MDNKRHHDRFQGGLGALKTKLKKITGQSRSTQTKSDCSQVDTVTEEQRRPLSSGTALDTQNDGTVIANNTRGKVSEADRLVNTDEADSVVTAPEEVQPGGNAQLHAGASILPEDLQLEENPDGTSREFHDATLTPIWTKALVEWRKEHPETYEALGKAGIGAMKNHDQMQGVLNRITGDEESTKRIRARWKDYQPTIAGFRGIAMGFANLDPHKIAPLVCVAVFFTIDVSTTFP